MPFDWNLVGVSVITVFVSELGDKSQIAAIALGGRTSYPKAVFLGNASTLVLASFLGVLLGEGTAQILPAQIVKGIAAIGFALMAIRLLWPNAESNG